MRMQFRIYHKEDHSGVFSLNEGQIQHEYSTFGSMLAHYFVVPGLQATCEAAKPRAEGVIVTVEGNGSAERLTAVVEEFLLRLNKMQISGRIGQPNFVATIV